MSCVLFQSSFGALGIKISGFYAEGIRLCCGDGACQNIPFFVATHWKFEFPLQDASREMKVGIGWDPTLKPYDPGGDEPASVEEFPNSQVKQRHSAARSV